MHKNGKNCSQDVVLYNRAAQLTSQMLQWREHINKAEEWIPPTFPRKYLSKHWAGISNRPSVGKGAASNFFSETCMAIWKVLAFFLILSLWKCIRGHIITCHKKVMKTWINGNKSYTISVDSRVPLPGLFDKQYGKQFWKCMTKKTLRRCCIVCELPLPY